MPSHVIPLTVFRHLSGRIECTYIFTNNILADPSNRCILIWWHYYGTISFHSNHIGYSFGLIVIQWWLTMYDIVLMCYQQPPTSTISRYFQSILKLLSFHWTQVVALFSEFILWDEWLNVICCWCHDSYQLLHQPNLNILTSFWHKYLNSVALIVLFAYLPHSDY
jgi:hypothetical protein